MSFNKDSLVHGSEYDYITRTSQNQGILQKTGFVNKENINNSGSWSLGLLQMDFFYRNKPWYAGQFVRKVIPRIEISEGAILFFTTLLNQQKQPLLSVLVRDVDEVFNSLKVNLPILEDGEIDFVFIENFVLELEKQKMANLDTYLTVTDLKNYTLTKEEQKAIDDFENGQIHFGEFKYKSIFNKIVQGRRLKKGDQIKGEIPFVMAGISNAGVANYISNPVASFPENSITVDIFGNTFYRNYSFGAGDDTGVYWNNRKEYSKETMLFFTTSMHKSIFQKFDFGKKLRSSQSKDFTMYLPSDNNQPNFIIMDNIISAVKKMAIKDVVLYVDKKQPLQK